MKRIITWALAIAGYSFNANAQLTLPYENGFDTYSEIDHWEIYRKGIGDEDGSTHWWEPMPSPGAVSAPNMLFHDYPVGYGGDELTDDWLVSDALDLSSGGRLSMKIWVYGIEGHLAPGDTIELYLLRGNRDPDMAEKTLLASFGSMVVSSGYINAPEWKDTSDINIPAAAGDAFIAFRYTNIFDWFTVGIDNVVITAGSSTNIEIPTNGKNTISLYPNPAQTRIYWAEVPQKEEYTNGTLVNLAGQLVRSFPAAEGSLDISDLMPGFYILRIGEATASFIKK